MLTAVLGALVDKFGLKGETLGEVAAGAVIKHSRDWNLTREATLGSSLHPHTPRTSPARVAPVLLLPVQLARGSR
jgi:acetyl-CoA C-acetyltransferase